MSEINNEMMIAMQKIGKLVSSIFKVFLAINLIMIIVSIVNVVGASGEGFRTHFLFFCIIVINFWIMMIFFFLMTLCMKFSIIHTLSATPEPVPRDRFLSWMMTFSVFPMTETITTDGDVLNIVLNESFQMQENTRREPPTLEKLLHADLKWGSVMTPFVPTDEHADDTCLICLHTMDHIISNLPGVVVLSCQCQTRFHKKCVLEWFYFSEKENHETHQNTTTCPSCRHVFTHSEPTSQSEM